jgi:hypothetical protein
MDDAKVITLRRPDGKTFDCCANIMDPYTVNGVQVAITHHFLGRWHQRFGRLGSRFWRAQVEKIFRDLQEGWFIDGRLARSMNTRSKHGQESFYVANGTCIVALIIEKGTIVVPTVYGAPESYWYQVWLRCVERRHRQRWATAQKFWDAVKAS